MAKGAVAKSEIFEKMLEAFEGSFMYNSGKELRIPWDEGGNEVQIKVALTCAKENVNPTGEVLVKPAAAAKEQDALTGFPAPKKRVEVTEEEKKNVEDLLKALGLDSDKD